MNWSEAVFLLPIGIVLGAAMIVVFFDLIAPQKDRYILPWIALSGYVLAGLSALQIQGRYFGDLRWFFNYDTHLQAGQKALLLKGAFVLDHFGLLVWVVACIAGALCVMASSKTAEESVLSSGEYYGLTLLAVAGMMLLAVSHDFLTLLLSLEIMSVATYILTGSARFDIRSNEAALKYLVLGAFSTAFLLMGMAFYLGVFGTFSLAPTPGVLDMLLRGGDPEAEGRRSLLLLAMGLLLVGAFFKVGASPFQFWVPDVYEGAPTPITALMSVGVKAAAFAFLARLAFETLGQPGFRHYWVPVAEAVAILTMIIGNLMAIRQNSVKRMLAYSSIAHSGYLILAFLLHPSAAAEQITGNAQSLLFYLLVYSMMTLGAFGVVSLVRSNGQPLDDIKSYEGLAKENPAVALCMATFMLSLAGLPPLGGFFGKFMIFSDAVSQGYIVAAVIGVLTSVVSLYYYLRVVVAMYMTPAGDAEIKTEYAWGANLLIYLTGIATLLLGLLPNIIMGAWQ